jgi:hypothetical protein
LRNIEQMERAPNPMRGRGGEQYADRRAMRKRLNLKNLAWQPDFLKSL